MSQQAFTTNNTALILQNRTEQTLVEVSALNDCGLMSESAIIIINLTGSQTKPCQYCIDSFCTDPNISLTTATAPSEDETGTVS
jgi:hypothetical protein